MRIKIAEPVYSLPILPWDTFPLQFFLNTIVIVQHLATTQRTCWSKQPCCLLVHNYIYKLARKQV